VQQQGSYLQTFDLADIKVGVDTKETIATRYGQPNVTSVFPDKNNIVRWYYVQRIVSESPVRGRRTSVNMSIMVAFNERGAVTDRKIISGETKLPITSKTTPEQGYNTTFIHETFANIGKFGQTQISE
jgi:outer membrane protein assembly factor BamE (lipoprotein component of BamABCDE complex)